MNDIYYSFNHDPHLSQFVVKVYSDFDISEFIYMEEFPLTKQGLRDSLVLINQLRDAGVTQRLVKYID